MSSSTLPEGVTLASAASLIDSTVNTLLSAADSNSAGSIQNLSLIHQARVSRLTRTANSLTVQFGANSTQAIAAQKAVVAEQTTVAHVNLVYQQATTTEPQIASSGWALHGRVYDSQLQPVAGHTVFLVDAQKNYLSTYGFSYTDSTGYFLINYTGTSGQTAPQSESSTEIFVEIVNTSAQPAYISATAFQPSLGNATYQNITLPVGEPILGDPPEAIRKVALPSTLNDKTNTK